MDPQPALPDPPVPAQQPRPQLPVTLLSVFLCMLPVALALLGPVVILGLPAFVFNLFIYANKTRSTRNKIILMAAVDIALFTCLFGMAATAFWIMKHD